MANTVRVVEIKKSVFENNGRRAEMLRASLRDRGVFMMNLMSSPGSGKTTTLLRTIESLGKRYRMGVLEADLDSDVDALAVSRAGARAIQVHTGGMCHLDAEMAREGLEAMGLEDLDFAIIENVGNLICTAEFDTGAALNAMILSVPEGDDKPLKYPVMFERVEVVLVNKMDTLSVFDFDIERFRQRVVALNPRAVIIPISAKTGEGIPEWIGWLTRRIESWRSVEGAQKK